jgi:hypothetical protein
LPAGRFPDPALQIVVRIGGTFGGGPDGEFKALDETIAELAGPHHVLGTHHGHDGASQGYEIGITAYFDGLGGANLDAGETFPALIGLLVVSLHRVCVEDHQVVGANVHASGLVATLASVTFFLNYKTWHLIYLLKSLVITIQPTDSLKTVILAFPAPPFLVVVRIMNLKSDLFFLSKYDA